MRKNNQIKPILKTQAAAQKVTVSKTTRNYRALVFQGYLVIAVLVFIGLAILAHIFPYFPIDLFMAKYWQSVHIPGLPAFMAFISYFGYGPQMPLIVTGLLLFILISGLRWEAVVGTVNIVGASLITSILKTIVGRGRPSQDLVNVITNLQDKSFPSGHVLTYTAFFGYLFFLSYILVKTSIFRRILLIIFGGLVLLVGPSRVYLGEHWPSDTFGAYLMGSIILLLTIYFYRWGKVKFFSKQPVAPSKPD